MSEIKKIEIIGINGLPLVREGDDIAKLIVEAARKQGIEILNNDIIVVAQSIVSKAEGMIVDLSKVDPSPFSITISRQVGKSPQMVEVILREARRIVKMRHVIITETTHGFICANSGVDESNVSGGGKVTLLPRDPDESARRIRDGIFKLTGADVAVIISDTHGRPFREGAINVAVGVAGLKPVWDRRGEKDLYGYVLHSTFVAVADELASAAELIMGQADEGIPVVIIRGYQYIKGEGSYKDLLMPPERDLFR
ncbi:MAG: coenzyme F420-0:L-glutamate ligase [Candidatus Jordarchaeales archaeon]